MKPVRDWPWTQIVLVLLLLASIMNYVELDRIETRLGAIDSQLVSVRLAINNVSLR
jgi:hypothetical protein